MRLVLLIFIIFFASISNSAISGRVVPASANTVYVSGACFGSVSLACSAAVYPDTLQVFSGVEYTSYCSLVKKSDGARTGSVNTNVCEAQCPGGQGRGANGICGACPSGETQQADGICGCPAGTELYNGACVAKCPANGADEIINISTSNLLASEAANQCIDNCSFTLVDEIMNSSGHNCLKTATGYTCQYQGTPSGSHCSTNTSNATTSSSTSTSSTSTSTTTQPTVIKPAGTVSAQSGMTISATESSSTTQNADGTRTTTTTTITTTTNPDGSQSISTVTGTATTDGGTGKGIGTGTGTGTGEGSGGDCDPVSKDYLNCMAGDQTPTDHTVGTAQTFGDALNNFQDGIKATPIGGLASASGIGGAVSVGSCPTPSFDAFNRTYVIDAHCAIYDAVSPMLTLVMHVIFVVWGILIILSA